MREWPFLREERTYSGECKGGPLDGSVHASQTEFFPLDMLPPTEADRIGRLGASPEAVQARRGWYEWEESASVFRWHEPRPAGDGDG